MEEIRKKSRKILVTGATGFIGKRLIYKLLEEGHEVWALVRVKGTIFTVPHRERLHLVYGDLQFLEKIGNLPSDLEAAYYLVHSMGTTVENLAKAEACIAQNFLLWVKKTAIQHLIFLSGIIEKEENLSPHLASRLQVEKILLSSSIPVSVLRASIIIGSGSASFEIIRDLCEKLPFMIAPKWVKNYCQPISIRDVLFYLTHILLHKESYHQIFDIGGPEALTFKEVLHRYASFRQLKRVILDIPFFTPKLSSYWLVLISSVRFSLCQHLVQSMKQSTRKQNNHIDKLFPHQCLTYEEALQLAFQKIAQNSVISTWMDAWDVSKVQEDVQNYIEVPQEGCLYNCQKTPITLPISLAQERIWSLGGDKGWYSMQWAWAIRGFMDRLLGGNGLNRGRRHPTELHVGDTIDFWRVLLAHSNKTHLILYAEMKLPGEAWLEFTVDKEKRLLIQKATFRPKGFLGRLYWYALIPFHLFLFRNMAKAIAQKNNRMS